MALGLSVLALLSVVLTRGAQSFECPKVKVQSLIADPEDCAKYYHCLPDGRLLVMRCPNGLMFDSRQQVCIWHPNAISCTSNNQLEPIESHQLQYSATSTNGDNSKTPNRAHYNSSHQNTTHETRSSNQTQNQVDEHKSVPTRKSRNESSRITTVRTTLSPAPSTTSQNASVFPSSDTAAITTTSATHPETTELAKKMTSSANVVGTLKESSEEGNVSISLGTLSSDADSRGRVKKAQETTGEKTVGAQRPDENYQQTSKRRRSGVKSQGGDPHSVSKRSPDDNLVEDNVQCPTAYAYIADPSSCSAFYHCYNWQPMRKLCPPGLFFDVRMHVCNWPHNVDCSEGYRAKNVFAFNGKARTYKKTTAKTGSTPKKTMSSRRKPVFQSLETTKVSTMRTTVASKPATVVQVTSTTDRNSSGMSEFSPSLQKFRDGRIYGRHSSFLSESQFAANATRGLTGQTSSSSSPTSTTSSISSGTSKTLLSVTVMASSPNQKIYNSQHHLSNKANISDLKTEQMTPTPKLAITVQSRQTEETAAVKLLSTESNLNSSLSEKSVGRRPSRFNDFPLKEPISRFPDLTSSSRSDSTNIFPWAVTSDLPHNNNVPELSAGAIKSNNGNQKNSTKELAAKVSTTFAASPNTSVDSNNKTTIWASQSSSSSSTKIPADFQSTASKGVTERPIPRKAQAHRSSISSQLSTKTETSHVSDTTTLLTSLSSSFSSTPQNSSQITTTAGNNESSSSTSNSTTAAIAAFKYLLNTANVVSKKGLKPSAPKTASLKAVTTKTTPIIFTATEIPFYAMRNLRVQPITWMNTGRLPVTSKGYWPGRRLRSHSHQTQRHTMNTFSFSRPSLAAGTSYTPATLQVHIPVLSAHRHSPPGAKIEKFMIKILNDDIPSKHTVSPEVSQDRRSEKNENTTSQIMDTKVNKTEVVNTNETEGKMLPSLFTNVDEKDDFTTAKTTKDMRVSGKVITDMTASISITSDANDENMFKTQGSIIKDPSDLSSSATKSMDDDDSNNLIIMNTDEVIDKRLESQDVSKGGQLLPKTPGFSKDKHSGETDYDHSIPRIQAFSALAGQEQSNEDKAKHNFSSDSNTTLTKKQDVSLKESILLILTNLSGKPLVNKYAEEVESKNAAEEYNSTTNTLKSFTNTTLTGEAIGTSTERPSASSNSAETTQNAIRTTTTRNQQTRDCNTTDCSSMQTKGNLTKTTVNTTRLSTQATQSKSFTTPTTKTIPTTTSEAPQIENSSSEMELFVATDILRAKDLLNGNDESGMDFQSNDYTVIPQASSDSALKNDKMRYGLDTLKANHKQETTQKIHTENLSEPYTSLLRQTTLKSDNSPSIKEQPDKFQQSSKTDKALPVSKNETLEEKVNNVSFHKSDTNPRSSSESTADPGNDNDDTQELEHTNEIAEHALYTNITTVGQPSSPVKSTFSVNETESSSLSTNTATHTTHTNYQSENQNSQVTLNSGMSNSAVNENKTQLNATATTVKNETAFVGTKEETQTGNITWSELLISLFLDEENNTAFLETTNITSLSVGLSAALENKTETLSTPNTTIQTVSTAQETQPVNTMNWKNISVNSVPLMPVNMTSENKIQGSEQHSVAYFSQNTNLKEEYMKNNADEHDSQYNDLKKSNVSVGSVNLTSETEQDNVKDKSRSNNYADTMSRFNNSNKANNSNMFSHSTTSNIKLETAISFTNFTNEANMIDTNITKLNEAVNSSSSRVAFQTVPETRDAVSSSSNNTSATSLPVTFATTLKTELQDKGRYQQSTVVNVDSEELSNSVKQNTNGSSEQFPLENALMYVSNVETIANKTTNNELKSPDQGKDSPSKDTTEKETHAKDDVTTASGNTGSNKSFVSFADLITWYLKHWRNYSKWRQDQMTSPSTVIF